MRTNKEQLVAILGFGMGFVAVFFSNRPTGAETAASSVQQVEIWTIISSVSSAITAFFTIVLALSLVLVIVQIKEVRRSRNTEVLIWAMNNIEEVRRRGKDNQISGEELNNISITLERISYFALKGAVDKGAIEDLWAPFFVAKWNILEPSIKPGF